jgi:hypothetical protein
VQTSGARAARPQPQPHCCEILGRWQLKLAFLLEVIASCVAENDDAIWIASSSAAVELAHGGHIIVGCDYTFDAGKGQCEPQRD